MKQHKANYKCQKRAKSEKLPKGYNVGKRKNNFQMFALA